MANINMVSDALRHRTAASLGVPMLFRYVPEIDTAKLVLLLQGGIIRLSNPVYFNDPWDCKPMFDPRPLEDDSVFESLKKSMRALIENHPDAGEDDLEEFDTEVTSLSNTAASRREIVTILNKSVSETIAQRYRVLSFASEDHSLLWSHYANGARGMCLEFSTNLLPFRDAYKVDYFSSYPCPDYRWTKPSTFVEVSLLSKALQWEHEKEFRIIAFEGGHDDYTRCDQELLSVPRDALTTITLGHSCEKDKVRLVADLVSRFASWVTVRKALRREYSFETDYEVIMN